MTLQEAAERLHCSTKTVRRRIAEGQLRASHIARGRWDIREDDLQAFLDATATRPREIRPVGAAPARPVQTTTARRRPPRTGGDGRLRVPRDRRAA